MLLLNIYPQKHVENWKLAFPFQMKVFVIRFFFLSINSRTRESVFYVVTKCLFLTQ